MLYIYLIDGKYVISVNKPKWGTHYEKCISIDEAQKLRKSLEKRRKKMNKNL